MATTPDPSAMTVSELDETYGDLEGYPIDGVKADKVAFVENYLASEGQVPPDEEVPGPPLEEETGPPEDVPLPPGDNYPADAQYAEAPFGTEEPPHIRVGDWVRLGFTDRVPEENQGHIAAVTDAAIIPHEYCEVSPRYHEHQDPNVPITVQVRDATNAILVINREDILEHETDRPYLEAHG